MWDVITLRLDRYEIFNDKGAVITITGSMQVFKAEYLQKRSIYAYNISPPMTTKTSRANPTVYVPEHKLPNTSYLRRTLQSPYSPLTIYRRCTTSGSPVHISRSSLDH